MGHTPACKDLMCIPYMYSTYAPSVGTYITVTTCVKYGDGNTTITHYYNSYHTE